MTTGNGRQAALGALFSGVPSRIVGDASVVITDLAYDSRNVVPGALFFAVAGERFDGHDFVADARHAGAVAAVVEREVATPGLAARVVVDDVRDAMGPVAHRFFSDPTAALRLAGVTGTNGKTTTAHMVHHVLSYRGRVGLMGTVEYRIGDDTVVASRTTPESVDLARAFAAMIEKGSWAAVVEVSSHALAQGRAAGCRFDAVAFTNLTQDHLDYHGTMEDYFQAKRLLFEKAEAGTARVVNADDEFGARMIAEGLADLTYGATAGASLRASVKRVDATGTAITLDGLGFEHASISLPVVGAHNVANAACAALTCRALDVPADVVAERLATVPQVPGRLERVDLGQPFNVLIDYAHTPDGLAQVIPAVRQVTRGRVLTVFGCGGDRDRAKRPLMGEIAAYESDRVYVTSDNPRSEDPAAIIEEILVGVGRVVSADVVVDADRRSAISRALADASPGDTVLVAGKGHETGQQIGSAVLPFDDREVARQLLAELGVA